ncbi:MAG: fluoride efflux transporter CrcB [Alphaproteobacteria bacterium]|nr:fluoride efflux transporter CrcB [Alphaproteobacteria bacterium]MBU0794731.1 fluoride efflux transporter CrcB [Alphaproteobacteria bacterium]MBU0875461.1 fluoride efflux transporter CrcB [Alphaproteobacteria bacterium]MBU1771412.1 fluoride efflux transporter CrcB [Alphaproteobacteria bacterium]
MLNTLLVMIGGAIGAALRYQLGRASLRVMGSGYPWGTLAANVLGGFLMGALVGWLAVRYQGQHSEQIRLLLAVGVLGGFTTFSAFSLETMLMFERGELLSALGYILLSVAASIGALALGMTIMRSAAA